MSRKNDEILTEVEAAEILGVTPNTLTQRRARARKHRDASHSPPWYTTSSGHIRYKRAEILAWQRSLTVLTPEDLTPEDPEGAA